MTINWIHKFDNIQTKQVHNLMSNEWWCNKRTLAEVEKVMEGSNVLFGAVDANGKIVGFCRVLTDYVFKALIFDVIIEAPYRSTGLGREIITNVLNNPKLSEVKSFELYCPDKISGFYKNLGFCEYESKLLGYKR